MVYFIWNFSVFNVVVKIFLYVVGIILLLWQYTVWKKNLAVKHFGKSGESVKIRQSFFRQPSRLLRQHNSTHCIIRQTFVCQNFNCGIRQSFLPPSYSSVR